MINILTGKNRILSKYTLRTLYFTLQFMFGIFGLILTSKVIDKIMLQYMGSVGNTTVSVVLAACWTSWSWDRLKLIDRETRTRDVIAELAIFTLPMTCIVILIGQILNTLVIGENGALEFSFALVKLKIDWTIYLMAIVTSVFSYASLPLGSGLGKNQVNRG